MTSALLPVEFTAPLIAPASPYGLVAATTWTEAAPEEARRWLPAGLRFRLRTHRASSAFGVWGAPWCVDPDDFTEDDVKTGPAFDDDDPDPFTPMTVCASDRLQECGGVAGDGLRGRDTRPVQQRGVPLPAIQQRGRSRSAAHVASPALHRLRRGQMLCGAPPPADPWQWRAAPHDAHRGRTHRAPPAPRGH
jgi:hypothetical protein